VALVNSTTDTLSKNLGSDRSETDVYSFNPGAGTGQRKT